MPPVINQTKCRACGKCYEACQSDVFFGSIPGQAMVVAYPDECWHCNACVMECQDEAVSLRLPLTHQLMFAEGPLVTKNRDK